MPVLGTGVDKYMQRFVRGTGTSAEPATVSTTNTFTNTTTNVKKKQHGGIIIDHMSLLLGCAGSVWYLGSLLCVSGSVGAGAVATPHAILLGCVFVGLGDAVGAVVGSACGRWYWDTFRQRRTCVCVCFLSLLNRIRNHAYASLTHSLTHSLTPYLLLLQAQ